MRRGPVSLILLACASVLPGCFQHLKQDGAYRAWIEWRSFREPRVVFEREWYHRRQTDLLRQISPTHGQRFVPWEDREFVDSRGKDYPTWRATRIDPNPPATVQAWEPTGPEVNPLPPPQQLAPVESNPPEPPLPDLEPLTPPPVTPPPPPAPGLPVRDASIPQLLPPEDDDEDEPIATDEQLLEPPVPILTEDEPSHAPTLTEDEPVIPESSETMRRAEVDEDEERPEGEEPTREAQPSRSPRWSFGRPKEGWQPWWRR